MFNLTDDGTFHTDGFNPIRSTTAEASSSTNMTPLPANFEPGPDDVICGRGKKCYNHIGNERFRLRVLTYLEEYSAAKSKLDKSGVLSKVVDAVRQQSPDGGFVKQDEKGAWHEVGDFLAREKTSQSFRDALHDQYKSSNISKKKRRQNEQTRHAASNSGRSGRGMMTRESQSEYEISSRLERLSNELLTSQDLFDMDYFSRRNSDVIATQEHDLQMQAHLPQRLQQSRDMQQFLGSTRRYSSGNIDFYPSSRERPVNEMARLPDPLFGTARNTTNATPSDFDRERLAALQLEFDRDRSMANSETDYNRSEHIPFVPMDSKTFHQLYPEMVYPNTFEDLSLHQTSSIHQTFPDSTFAKRVSSERDRKRPAKEIEPVQFPVRRSRKTAVPETFMKKVATNPYPSTMGSAQYPVTMSSAAHPELQFSSQHQSASHPELQFSSQHKPVSHPEIQLSSQHQPASHPDVHFSSHHQQPGTLMVGGQRISRDLMECLDKMTYHSIADDNPFEPFPIAPHQEVALNIKRRSSNVAAAAAVSSAAVVEESYYQRQSQQQNPSIDESERDEFAEG